MKAYKLEILVIDFEGLGEAGIRQELENARFANDCLSLQLKSIAGKDIGECSDEHPLNKLESCESEYRKLFTAD